MIRRLETEKMTQLLKDVEYTGQRIRLCFQNMPVLKAVTATRRCRTYLALQEQAYDRLAEHAPVVQ
jgi:hypothetical protein